ncbi:uncharacterized protein LOC142558130 [Dermacentor variabilis]|uniref:uncharacterized protein LOC142558130 n=1 Tax=Dermacentor variabilis TaxID=34621 RepID=UPI003F5C73E5
MLRIHDRLISILVLWIAMGVHSGAGARWLDLKEEVEAYVKKMNETFGGQVSTWGMTKDYAYWRDRRRIRRPPVSGEIDWSEYAKCDGVDTLREQEMDCAGRFKWNIRNGIKTPFYLEELTLVPALYKGVYVKAVKLNVSGLSKHSEEMTWGHSSSQTQRAFFQICAFSLKIDFGGYFAYDLSNRQEGNFRWIVENITKLEDKSKGLVAKDGKLTYFARGRYSERITCDDGVKSGKVG